MYSLDLMQMTEQEFLDEYWQKKPVVIRQGFKDFQDPISADEIAGIAMEEEVQSRLIYKENGTWQAAFGPFGSYEHLGNENWSLVGQALDNFSEEAAQLLEPFRFIPHWRLDDLMVSFATPGGGVGPHIDNYDVFICQGSGKRRWKVGDRGQHKEFAAHAALLHVEPFESIIEVELDPGDILYIPPGFPHEGVTLETSLSFSVGYRTNSAVSLLSGFADYLIDNQQGEQLLADPQRKVADNSGEITNGDYASLKTHLQNLVTDDQLLKRFIGSFLSSAKHELDVLIPDEPFECDEVSQLLSTHAIKRLGGLRAFYFEETLTDGICYINGNEVNFDGQIAPAVKLICDQVTVHSKELSAWFENAAFVTLMAELLTQGYWYLAED